MSGHTPGPWIVEELDGYITGHVISPNKTNPSRGVLKPLSITDPSNMCAADADLIAGAPETAAELERAQETIADLLKALKAAEQKAWDHAEGLLENARQAGVEGRDEDDRNLVGRSAPFMSIYNILHPAISRAEPRAPDTGADYGAAGP